MKPSDVNSYLIFRELSRHFNYEDRDKITIDSINGVISVIREALDEAIEIRDKLKED